MTNNFWTKKNVETMYTDTLVKFYNETVAVIHGFDKYGMEIKATTAKRLALLEKELIKRGEIKGA
jgi:hypothetical protein